HTRTFCRPRSPKSCERRRRRTPHRSSKTTRSTTKPISSISPRPRGWLPSVTSSPPAANAHRTPSAKPEEGVQLFFVIARSEATKQSRGTETHPVGDGASPPATRWLRAFGPRNDEDRRARFVPRR